MKNVDSGWSVLEFHDTIHVLPNNDKEPHHFTDCHCGVKYVDSIYVHSSFDGREILERMEASGSC